MRPSAGVSESSESGLYVYNIIKFMTCTLIKSLLNSRYIGYFPKNVTTI